MVLWNPLRFFPVFLLWFLVFERETLGPRFAGHFDKALALAAHFYQSHGLKSKSSRQFSRARAKGPSLTLPSLIPDQLFQVSTRGEGLLEVSLPHIPQTGSLPRTVEPRSQSVSSSLAGFPLGFQMLTITGNYVPGGFSKLPSNCAGQGVQSDGKKNQSYKEDQR